MTDGRAAQEAKGTDLVLGVGFSVFLLGSFLVWLSPQMAFPDYDIRRVLQILFLSFAVVWSVRSRSVREQLIAEFSRIPSSVRYMLVLGLGVGILSSLLAERPLIGFRDVALLVLLFHLGLTMGMSYRQHRNASTRPVLDGIVVVSISYLAMYLVGAATFGSPSSLPGFEHPRMFNGAHLVVLPLLAVAAIDTRWTRLQRGLLVLTLTGWWYLLFVSGGRAALLAILVGSVVAIMTYGRAAVRWFVTYALTGLSAAALYAFTLFGSVAPAAAYGVQHALERGVTGTGREHLWRLAISYVQEQPLLGIGPGHFAYAPRAAYNGAGPHNFLLQLAAEWGGVVALLFALAGLWAFIRWITSQRTLQDHPPLNIGIAAAVVGAIIDAMFSASANYPLAATLIAAVLGIAWGSHETGERSRSGRDRHASWIALFVVGAILLLVVAPLTHRSPDDNTGGLIRPRFWLNGIVVERSP